MVRRIELSLNELRPLRSRIDDHRLETDDWPIFGALIDKLIGRAESLQERMQAKIDAQQAAESAMEEPSSDAASREDASTEPAPEADASRPDPDKKRFGPR